MDYDYITCLGYESYFVWPIKQKKTAIECIIPDRLGINATDFEGIFLQIFLSWYSVYFFDSSGKIQLTN